MFDIKRRIKIRGIEMKREKLLIVFIAVLIVIQIIIFLIKFYLAQDIIIEYLILSELLIALNMFINRRGRIGIILLLLSVVEKIYLFF